MSRCAVHGVLETITTVTAAGAEPHDQATDTIDDLHQLLMEIVKGDETER